MGETESKLKEMIKEKYSSLSNFCEAINMPWTTLDSILKRGIANSNITNVLKITKELEIDTESLVSGKIIPQNHASQKTIAAHKEDGTFTPEELEKIEEYKKLLLAARPKE
jgi:predicted transcriptional regulator